MTPFLAGVLFGVLFGAAVIVIFMTRIRRPRRHEIEPWSEATYHQPTVNTRILVKERHFTL